MSDITRKAKVKYALCKATSILLTIMPLLIYIVIGFANGDIHKGQKIFLGFTCITAIMLTMFNTFFKYNLRSPLFILLLGIYYALDNVLTLIIIICISIVLDEFIFSPLAKKYKQKYTINKEFDERL